MTRMVAIFFPNARPMKHKEKHKYALAYTTLRPTSSQKGAKKSGAMAQTMLKRNKPNWPISVDTPNSSVMPLMVELYAVVASPMKSVMRFSIVVTLPFHQGLQLKGFTGSPMAYRSTMYSFPSCSTISVKVSGISMSTSVSGPCLSCRPASLFPSLNRPPTILPTFGGTFSALSISGFWLTSDRVSGVAVYGVLEILSVYLLHTLGVLEAEGLEAVSGMMKNSSGIEQSLLEENVYNEICSKRGEPTFCAFHAAHQPLTMRLATKTLCCHGSAQVVVVEDDLI